MEATKSTAAAAAQTTKKKKKKVSPYMVFSTIVIILLAIAFAFPLYWIITGSFKTQVSINATTPEWWPSEWVMTNYGKLFSRQKAPLWEFAVPFSSRFSADGKDIIWWSGPQVPAAVRWLINTVFMAVTSMILTCITSAMAGYALAKKRFVGRSVLFTLIVCAMALPKQVILIPLLREMSGLQLYNTIWAVIFPIVGWPFGVFLMKQFSEGIPGEMLEAARIDGASEATTFDPHCAAHHQARHRRTGHLHLHQLLERLLHAADHAVQHQQADDLPGHCQAAGRELDRLRPDHGRCRPGRRAHHHRVPGIPEVFHQGHYDGCR